ncbi:MAG: CoA transferase, partial [Deltaproteobacteria bacterium]|nr:CoA transferase [Deltaproteobacteria bacterium]
ETFRPGYLEDIGLGYDVLKAINPRIILTSITPFGQTGPYRDFEGCDLVAQAMGGLMHCLGFPDDPPCMIGGSQSLYCGSIEGALGTVMALYVREDTGEGQQVDVSCQEAVLICMETAMQHFDMRGEIKTRIARETAIVPGIGMYPCADGHVFAYVVPGAGATWDVIVDWLDSEGKAGDLKDPKWQEVWDVIADFKKLVGLLNDMPKFMEMLQKFTYVNERMIDMLGPKTKKQIFEETASRRIMICPAQNAKDLLESPQLEALKFFVDVEHPELGMTVKYPGAYCYEIAGAPWRISRRPPLIGEHNDEIYVKELGLTKAQLALLKGQGAI